MIELDDRTDVFLRHDDFALDPRLADFGDFGRIGQIGGTFDINFFAIQQAYSGNRLTG